VLALLCLLLEDDLLVLRLRFLGELLLLLTSGGSGGSPFGFLPDWVSTDISNPAAS